MKKLFLLLLTIISLRVTAQTDSIILKKGSPGYVTFVSQGVSYNFARGYIGTAYYYGGTDTLLGLNINSGYPKVYVQPNKRTYYHNGDVAGNPKFPSMDSLHKWNNANLEPVDTSYLRDTVSGELVTLFNHYTDIGNTDTSVVTLYSDTIASNTLAANGDKLEGYYVITMPGAATGNVTVTFAGTQILNIGTQSEAGVVHMQATFSIIRVSNTTVLVVTSVSSGALTLLLPTVTTISALTLTSTAYPLRVTAHSTGLSAAANDIVGKFATIRWISH